MKTKFGNASILSSGHYRITSRKEGNHGKLLHRLIWEDFWRTEVPKGYVIHHKNGNPQDNCILNLQLMRDEDHCSLHHKDKHHSDESKLKMSLHQNKSGYYRVSILKNKNYKQGFIWSYYYYDENRKKRTISSIDIKVLEKKVKSKGLKWQKLEGDK